MSSEAIPFSAPDPQDLAALFPGYAINSLIACGGMGAVYHATQVALDREVAIKILPREMSSDEAFREGFAAEARAMAKLNHPNLIGVYDFGEVDGMLFIIMEFVPGQSLYHATYGATVQPRDAARLMSEICSGIAEAHRHGILHRDIKPANILLDAHARPKVGDFGLARPIGTTAKEGEVIFGTPHYTAPEVVDNPGHVDARADVFSLGVMLHELLTNSLPANDPRPASAICGCSPKFDAIIKRATQPVPALRYPDAASMVKDLSELAAIPTPTIAARGGAQRPPAVRRPTARHTVVRTKSSSGFVWFLLILAAAGGGYYYYTNHYNKPTPPPAPVVEESSSSTERFTLPPIQKKEKEPKEDLPENSDSDNPGGSSLFDHRDAGFGTIRPKNVRPKYEGPKPVFDVSGFLTRAREIMKNKAAEVRSKRDRALASNIEEFDRSVRSNARGEGTAAVSGVVKAMKAIRDNGNRIPDSFKIEGLPDAAYSESFAAAVKKQEEADAAYVLALKPHADTYVYGIDLQIQRLQSENDPGAIQMLKEEIDATKEDDSHFASVIGE